MEKSVPAWTLSLGLRGGGVLKLHGPKKTRAVGGGLNQETKNRPHDSKSPGYPVVEGR